MGTELLEYAYAGDIVKYDKNPDGTLFVYGVASSSMTDHDGQVCDAEWLKSAMPDWFKFANVREQHSSIAAGVGKELTEDDGKWLLKTHVVDANTVKKVEAGVLKGYSVGIRGGRVMRGKGVDAPGGRIVGGRIVEVSLVDRPCNPESLITITKAYGGAGGFAAVDNDGVILKDDEPDEQVESDDQPSLFGDDEPEYDEDADGAEGDGDDEDADGAGGDEDELSTEDAIKALLADVEGDERAEITKGLLDFLIHGPKPDKHKRDRGGKFAASDSRSRALQRQKDRARRLAERKAAQQHRARMDSEAARDAQHAQLQGRHMEAGEHRARLGHYDKMATLGLVHAINSGLIEKGMTRPVYDEADDMDGAREVVAQIAELMISELEELQFGRFEELDDIRVLLEAAAAMRRFYLNERRQAGGSYDEDSEVTRIELSVEPDLTKGDDADEATVEWDAVDEPPTPATLDVAEIVKAQVAEATRAHEGQIADLTAQLAQFKSMPVPGGPFIVKSAPAAVPAPAQATEADKFRALAASPHVSEETRAALLAAAAAGAAAKG